MMMMMSAVPYTSGFLFRFAIFLIQLSLGEIVFKLNCSFIIDYKISVHSQEAILTSF